MNAEQFSGTYVESFNSMFGPPCVGDSSGTFTATSFPLVSGTYTGMGNFQSLANGVLTVTPVTIETTLQQGSAVLDPATGISKVSNIAIGGSIRVQGFPCFKSGVANTTLFKISQKPLNSIQGNIMNLDFTMDDGSTLGMIGVVTDTTESHISAQFVVNPFGTGCGAGASVFPPADLIRQN
jgi:hypothetical protein